MGNKEHEYSSFRDRDGYVFYENNQVYRQLTSQKSITLMEQLLASDLYGKLKDDLIETSMYQDVMHHQKVNLITYPYEWSFSMLADAALVQLNILSDGIKEGFLLKDGSGYNTVLFNGRMVFIDLLSIGNLSEFNLWEGYHQFCEHFLYPLMLKVYKGMNFQSIWRGTIDGVGTSDFAKMLTIGDYFRRGVMLHGVLKNKLGKIDRVDTKATVHLSKDQKIVSIKRLANNLLELVNRLRNSHSASIWTDYAQQNTYIDGKYELKKEFIQNYVKTLSPTATLVDIGCNTGDFSAIASQHVILVKSVDFDADCIDRIYLKIKNGHLKNNIVPIVADLMNMSPSLGWDLKERKDLITRLKSDAFLVLALIHHLCISKNLPLSYFAEFLRKLAPEGIVEWVGIEDPMVQVLLKNRKNIFADYTWENFKNEIEKFFSIEKIFEFENSNRKLCVIRVK